jgi:hypothetical protein
MLNLLKWYQIKLVDATEPYVFMLLIYLQQCHMAARSNLYFESLQRTSNARLRVKTIKNACDILIQAIEEQGHFKLRNTCSDGYHGSIDGSKHLTKKETIKARYSSKYFGFMKGVVSMNMVINEVPVNWVLSHQRARFDTILEN